MEHAHITHRPDWACEILSKSTAKIDRGLKMQIYAREEVEYLWFVDPHAHSLEVFKLAAGAWVPIEIIKEKPIAEVVPFDAVPLPLSRIWAD